MRFITLRSIQNMHLTDHSLGLEHLICPIVILARKATGKPEGVFKFSQLLQKSWIRANLSSLGDHIQGLFASHVLLHHEVGNDHCGRPGEAHVAVYADSAASLNCSLDEVRGSTEMP